MTATMQTTLSQIAWPDAPIPEVLARVEALAGLLPLVEPGSPAGEHVLRQLRADGRILDEIDSFGLLAGTARDRYLATVTALAAAAPVAAR